MESYPSYHLSLHETQREDAERPTYSGRVVSDEELVVYVKEFITSYRDTVEEFFRPLASSIDFYRLFPFHTTVVRFGTAGAFIAHRPDTEESVRVMELQDFDPPFTTVNIFDVIERLNAVCGEFDFSGRTYGTDEAKIRGMRRALGAVLEHFWSIVVPSENAFASICSELIRGEQIEVLPESRIAEGIRVDAIGRVKLDEPAGFRRFENWVFEFKEYPSERLSADHLRQVESYLSMVPEQLDVACLITSEDLTSIGRSIVVQNPRMRVWDRTILNVLIHKHPAVLRKHFADYPLAVEQLTNRLNQKPGASEAPKQLDAFSEALKGCPTGQSNFSDYEKIGLSAICYVFDGALGKSRPQEETSDKKQRRDVLFRNLRTTGFLNRVYDKYDADFLIVDFKNYGDKVGADVIQDVDKYANKALGRCIVVVSRQGASEAAEAAQLRVLRDRDIIVLVVSDEHLLEMVRRKEAGQNPDDLLDDLLDELLRKY